MPTERVGQIQVPGGPPQNIRLITDDRPVLSNDELAGGIQWAIAGYGAGDVLRYGADKTGGSDSSVAFQAAFDGLSATVGGKVLIPEGVYTAGDILIDQAKFINGGVEVVLHPRAVVNVPSGATYFLKVQGTAAATPMSHITISGGRIVGAEDGAQYGIWVQNCANVRIQNCSIVRFFSSTRSTRTALYIQYSIYVSIFAPQFDTCDFGINCENDATNSFRQTTVNIFGGSIKTCYRALRVDDCTKVVAVGTAFENSSTAVYYDFTRTTGINNFSCDLQNCYFEKNGKHIKITEHGTAITRGISIINSFFENLDTHYIGGVKEFEDAGSMLVKIDVDGSYHTISGNYFSSTALNTGTHDGSGNSATLDDSTATWAVNELIGFVVTNTTDGSSGTITANTATQVTATLAGGTDNDWDASDAYSIAGKEIWIRSGATANYIGPQATPPANVAVLDNGTSTFDNRTPLTTNVDATITAKFRHADDVRLENAVTLAGLDNAGSSWRDLLQINASDNVVVGDVNENTLLFSANQPDWFDGTSTEAIATSSGTTGGASSAGAGNQYVEINVNGTVYKVLHDGTV